MDIDMDYKRRWARFNEHVWMPYLSKLEAEYPGRKTACFRQWYERSGAAQHYMYRYLVDNGGLSPPRNPFFWIQHFAEPEPHNLNGTVKGQRMMDTGKASIACYKGDWGIYSNEEIRIFGMER